MRPDKPGETDGGIGPVFGADGHVDEGAAHAFVDGALPDADAARVVLHLSTCPRCAALVAEARGLAAAAGGVLRRLDGAPGVVAVLAPRQAPGAAEVVRSAPTAPEPVGARGAGRGGPRGGTWRAGGRAAAAALVVAGVGGGAYLASRRSPPPSGDAAAAAAPAAGAAVGGAAASVGLAPLPAPEMADVPRRASGGRVRSLAEDSAANAISSAPAVAGAGASPSADSAPGAQAARPTGGIAGEALGCFSVTRTAGNAGRGRVFPSPVRLNGGGVVTARGAVLGTWRVTGGELRVTWRDPALPVLIVARSNGGWVGAGVRLSAVTGGGCVTP